MSASTTLLTFASLQNDTSATSDLNNNFSAINTALTSCLSITGQAPNQMQANLDMNSNRVLNLPAPVSINEPMRLADATTLNGGGTVAISQLPTGGTLGQVLTKNSSNNFDVSWVTPSVNVTTGKTVNIQNSLTLAGTDGTTITFQGTDTYVGRTTTDTFQNKTFNANVNGNVLQVGGITVTGVTGTGAVVLASTPQITNPTLVGTVAGVPTFSGNNFLTLGNIVQQGMFTLLGNTASSTQNISSFTIGSLTQKASPASGDYILIQDNSSSPAGALKYALVSAVATAGSVSSIAGNTGAFTLAQGITNSTNQIGLDASYHRGWLGGLTLSNDGASPNTVLDIAQGVCCDDSGAYMMKIANFTKSTASWATGSGNGGLDTGSVAGSTWYHVYIIARTDTGAVDVLFSTSATSPTFPGSYTVKRRIGSFRTDASAHIISFFQNGDSFYWSTPIKDVNQAIGSFSFSSATLTNLTVPSGIKVEAICYASLFANATTDLDMYFSDPASTEPNGGAIDDSNGAANLSINVQLVASAQLRVYTNTSQQIRIHSSNSPAAAGFNMSTIGWVDLRGKYS